MSRSILDSLPARRLSPTEARGIMESDLPAAELCWIYGVSDKTISDVRSRRVHFRDTVSCRLRANVRRKGSALSRRVVREIFTSTLSAADAAIKYNVSRKMVLLIRSRQRRAAFTKDLTRPLSWGKQFRVPAKLVRLIYKADGTVPEIEAATGVSSDTIYTIKQRRFRTDITADLGLPYGGGPITAEVMERIKNPRASKEKYLPIRRLWEDMIARTANPSHQFYSAVGEKGIKVSKPWQRYETFRKWVQRQGVEVSESTEILRYDRGKDYSADNCVLD